MWFLWLTSLCGFSLLGHQVVFLLGKTGGIFHEILFYLKKTDSTLLVKFIYDH